MNPVNVVSGRVVVRRSERFTLDAELEVRRGEVVAVMGPSGAGKSTLLQVLAGELRPTDGRVVIGGDRLSRRHALDPRRRRVVMLGQNPLLFPHLTVRENVAFGLRAGGASRQRAHTEADEWLWRVGLAGAGEHRPRELSGGQQQRVALARALATEPRLLLLDEPFGAVDELTRRRLNIELPPLWSGTTTTTLLVTHSIPEAVLLADRVLVMSPRPGRIVADLPVELERPRRMKQLHSRRFAELVDRIGDLLGVDRDPES